MTSTDRVTLLIETTGPALSADAAETFGEDSVSESSNLAGGVSLAVFLVVTIKSLQPVVRSVLDFLAKREGRYAKAEIVVQGKKISLKGYRPEDVQKILDLPAFKDLR